MLQSSTFLPLKTVRGQVRENDVVLRLDPVAPGHSEGDQPAIGDSARRNNWGQTPNIVLNQDGLLQLQHDQPTR